MVMYIITSKLNSTFRKIGIAMDAKMTAKAISKTDGRMSNPSLHPFIICFLSSVAHSYLDSYRSLTYSAGNTFSSGIV